MSGIQYLVTDDSDARAVLIHPDDVIIWCLGRTGITIKIVKTPAKPVESDPLVHDMCGPAGKS